uniref:Uncharacterized protein n=1 Tax=Oryza barthii TaxID=65489 RepID=A0A0D3HEG8_9ORYZ
MVATAYGSVACLDVLLSPPYLVDPNRASASSLSTPLHLAAVGGATFAPTSVSCLLAAGADDDDDEVEERQGEEEAFRSFHERGLEKNINKIKKGIKTAQKWHSIKEPPLWSGIFIRSFYMMAFWRARNLQKLSDNSGEFERGSVDLQMIRFEELLGNKPKFSTLKGGDGMRDPSLMHMGGPHCTSSISDDHEELSSISGVFSMPSSRPYNVPPLHAGRAQTPIRKTLACAETSRETPSFCLIASQGRHPTLSVHSPLRVSDDELTSDNDRPLLQATAA